VFLAGKFLSGSNYARDYQFITISYTEIVKIAAIRSIFAAKSVAKCVCGRVSAANPAGGTYDAPHADPL